MSKYNLSLGQGCAVGLLFLAVLALVFWLQAWVLHWGWNIVAPSHAITMMQAYAAVVVLSLVGGFFKSSGGKA